MFKDEENYKALYWKKLEDNKIKCELCPRNCIIKENQSGFCKGRKNLKGQMSLLTFGKITGIALDPIEKKPLFHFYPGTEILSFGTAGCNLACKFCQNASISQPIDLNILMDSMSPQEIANKASRLGAKSVAFTYNEPTTFIEYAMATADECHKLNIKTVAVSAGFINKKPRGDFYKKIDAANIDLKAFNESFYKKLCGTSLSPVLDTLVYLKKETNVWLEVTTLIIPNENDNEKELHKMSEWFLNNLGKEVPWHFTAFHPTYKYTKTTATKENTLLTAKKIAISYGLKYIYLGNILNTKEGSTYCYNCKTLLIFRSPFSITNQLTNNNHCPKCNSKISGIF